MKRVVTAVVLALLTVVLPVWAQGPQAPATPNTPAPTAPPPPSGGIPGMGMMFNPMMIVRVPQRPIIDRMMNELNLSEDQRSKVQEAFEKYGAKLQPLMTQYQDSLKQMQTALNETQFDAAKVRETSAKALKAEESVISASLDFWTAFRGVLTTEQNQKLSQMLPSGGRPGARPGGPEANRPPANPQGPPPPAPAPPGPGTK